MKRYLLDTNAASHCIFRRKGMHDRVRQARVAGHRIGIGLPVLGELFGGVEYSSTREDNLAVLLRNLNLFRLWPFDAQAAREYGRLYALLRRQGKLIQQVDLQIAAISLSIGNCTIITSDTDFQHVPGIQHENWIT